jgi:hypothetical protein
LARPAPVDAPTAPPCSTAECPRRPGATPSPACNHDRMAYHGWSWSLAPSWVKDSTVPPWILFSHSANRLQGTSRAIREANPAPVSRKTTAEVHDYHDIGIRGERPCPAEWCKRRLRVIQCGL